MNRIIAAIVLGSAVTAPVMAQMPQPRPPKMAWNPGTFWRGAPANPYDRIQFLHERVNRGVRNGSLDRREAMRVNRELAGVRAWIQQKHWQDGGRLTPPQRAMIQGRLDQISRQIRWMKRTDW